MKISILDTETTGLNHQNDYMIEVAIVNFCTDEKQVVDAKSILILPEDPVAVEATQKIHGISSDLLINYGMSPIDAEGMILDMTLNSDAIIAHNAEFDRGWFQGQAIYESKWICSQDDIQWPKESNSKSLAAIALAHDVGIVSAHRALDDCLTLARLLRRVGEISDLNEILKMAMRPKARFKAIGSFSEKDEFKKHGFRWDPDQKIWYKRIALDDVDKLPFKTIQVLDIF